MGESAILEPSVEVLSNFKIEFKRTRRKFRLVPTLTLLLLTVFLLVQNGESVCVWEGSGGFKLACGFRQSGLFRIRSVGGVKGWAGAGFTIGDEDGFKDSLSNSDKRQQQVRQYQARPQQQNQQQQPQFWLQQSGQQQQPSNLVSLNNLPQQQQSLWPNLLALASQVEEDKVLKPDSSLVPVEQQGKTSVQKRSSYWNWPPNHTGPTRGRQPNVAHKQGYPVPKIPGKLASPLGPPRSKNHRNKIRPQNNGLRPKAPRVSQAPVGQTAFRPMPYGQWNGQVPPRLMPQQNQLRLPQQHRLGLPYSPNLATLPGVKHTHHLSPQLLAEVQKHKAKLQMQQILNANYDHSNVGLEEPGFEEVTAGYDTNIFPDIYLTTTTPKNKLTPLQKQLLEAEAQVKIKNGKRKKIRLIKEGGKIKRGKIRRPKPFTTSTFKTTEDDVTENDISSTTEESTTKSFKPSDMDLHRHLTSELPAGTEQTIEDGHKPEEHQDVFSWYNVLKSMASDDDRIRALQILQSMSLPSTPEVSTTTTTPRTTTTRTTTTTASPFPNRNLINPLLVKGYDPRFPPNHPVNRIILRDMTTTTTTTPKIFFKQNNYYNPQNHFAKTGKSRFEGHNQQNRVPQRPAARPSQERFSYYELDSKETLDRINLTRAYNNKFYNHYNKSTVKTFGVSPKIADIYWIHAATTQRSKQFPVPPVNSRWTGVTEDDIASKRWKFTTTASTTPKTAEPELQVLEHESESTEHSVPPNKNRFQNWYNFKKDDRLGSSGSVNFVTDDNFQKHSSEKISPPTTAITSEPTSTASSETTTDNTTGKPTKRVPIIRRFRTSTASTTSTTSTTTEATTQTTDDDLETTSKRQRGHRRRFKFRTYPPTTSTTTQTTESTTVPRRGDVDISKSSENEPNLLPELSSKTSGESIPPTAFPGSGEREKSTNAQDFGPTKPTIFLSTMPDFEPKTTFTPKKDQVIIRSSEELGTTEKEATKLLSSEETKSVSHEGQDQRLLYVTSVPYQVTEKNSVEPNRSSNEIQNHTDEAEEQEEDEGEEEEKLQIVPVQVKSSVENLKPISQEYEPQQQEEERNKLKISSNTINSVELQQQSELSVEQVGPTPTVPTEEFDRKPPVFTKILQHLITPIRDGQGHNHIINGFNPTNVNRQSVLTPAVNNYKQQVNRLTAKIQEANQGQFSRNGGNFLQPVMKLYNVEPLLPHPTVPTYQSAENTQDLNGIDLQGQVPSFGPSSQYQLLGPFPMPDDDKVSPAPPPALQRPELTQFHQHKLRIANLLPTSTFRPTQPAPSPTPTVRVPQQQQDVQVYSWSVQPEEYESQQNSISRLGFPQQQPSAQVPQRRPLPVPAQPQQQFQQQYFNQQPSKQAHQPKVNQVQYQQVAKSVQAQNPMVQQQQFYQQPSMSAQVPQPQPSPHHSVPMRAQSNQQPSISQPQHQHPIAHHQPHQQLSMHNRGQQQVVHQQPNQQSPVPTQNYKPHNNRPEPSMIQQPSIQIYEHSIVSAPAQPQPAVYHQPGLQQWPIQRQHQVPPTQHYYQQVPQGSQVHQHQQPPFRPAQPPTSAMFNQKFGFHPQSSVQNLLQPSAHRPQSHFQNQIPIQAVWQQPQLAVIQTSARPPVPTAVVHTQAHLPPAQPLPPTPSDRLSPPLPITSPTKASGSQVDSYTFNSLMQSRMKQKEAQEAEWRKKQQEAWEQSQKFQDLNEPKEIQVMSEKEAELKLATLINQQPNRTYTNDQMDKIKKIIALHQLEKSLKKPSSTKEPAMSSDLSKTIASITSGVSASKKRPSDRVLSNMLVRKSNEIDQAPNRIDSEVPSSAALAEASEHRDTMVVDIPTADLLKALAMQNAQNNQQKHEPILQQESSDVKEVTAAVDLSSILAFPKQIRMKFSEQKNENGMPLLQVRNAPKSFYPGESPLDFDNETSLYSDFQCKDQDYLPGLYADPNTSCQVFHLCAKTDKGHMQKSFRCPRNTIFDQEVLRCNWSLYVDCDKAPSKYQVNKYLSESFQFLRALGKFSSSYEGIKT